MALGKHTENYLALYFDYFYGLKGERNVSSFIEYLDDYNFSILTPDFKIVDSIFKFISSLDDLHSDVIYYGTDIPDLDLLFSGEYGEREEKIIDAYIQYECYQYEEAITFEEYEEYYLMNLIYFTEETSAVIKESLQGLDPNKDLIIDVSCNTGGFLLGVIELVSFLTDENIELSIRNSLSNELVTQTFYTQENTAVSNDIFVITSNVSYSGANLFASLVKDMNLGLIIGEDSSGGGFIVDTTVLPNGTYIMSSGVLNMLNDDYESIESGIEVDVDYIRTDNWYSNYKFIGHLFENLVDYDVTHTDDNGSIQVSYTLHDNNEYEINKIIVEVIDLDTGSSILDESNFGTSFTVGGSFINTSSYSITVSVTFTINDIEVVEIIYDEVVNK